MAAAVLVAALVLAALLWMMNLASMPDRSDVRLAAWNAATELERSPVAGLGVNGFDVQRALARANQGQGRSESIATALLVRYAALLVRYAGMPGDTSYFEITNTDHEYPACLVVTTSIDLLDSPPSFPDARVEDGPCPKLTATSPPTSPPVKASSAPAGGR
jgi:hypothetical protein